jgi:hypothetical protein
MVAFVSFSIPSLEEAGLRTQSIVRFRLMVDGQLSIWTLHLCGPVFLLVVPKRGQRCSLLTGFERYDHREVH